MKKILLILLFIISFPIYIFAQSEDINKIRVRIFSDQQIEEVLFTKVNSSPAKEYVELYAGVVGEEFKCYL